MLHLAELTPRVDQFASSMDWGSVTRDSTLGVSRSSVGTIRVLYDPKHRASIVVKNPCSCTPLSLGRSFFRNVPMHRSSGRQFRRIGAMSPLARFDGGTENERKMGTEGFMSRAWDTLHKPIVFPDLVKCMHKLPSTQKKLWTAGIVFLLAVVAWLRNLAASGLIDDTEPLFVEAARQMLVTGDFVTPQFNAQPRFDKPILIYWLMALSGKFLGPSVWALRLPSTICALGLLMGLLVTVKQFGTSHSYDDVGTNLEKSQALSSVGRHYVPAVITIAAFALNLEVVAWGSTALSDMLLTSMIGASLLSFFWGYVGRSFMPPKHKWGYMISAVFMGLACLSKGPVGIALPVLVCALFLLSRGELLEVLVEEIPYWKSIMTLLIINVPWYGAMTAKHGLSYILTFFGYHNLERFMQGVNHHGGRPWWYGLAVVAVLYYPWSLSIPPALLHAGPWRQSWRMVGRCQTLPLFATSWLIVGFVLFALSSSQLPSYYLPVAPAIAILFATHTFNATSHDKHGILSSLVPAILYELLAVLFWHLPGFLQLSGDKVAAEIGRLICERHLHKIACVLFGLAGIITFRTAEFTSALGSWMQSVERKGETQIKKSTRTFLPIWVVHATVMACFLGAFMTPVYSLVDCVRQAPLRQLAYMATTQQKTGEPLIMVGPRMPSVVYYSKLPTAFFDSPGEAVLAVQEDAAPLVTSALVITEVDAALFQPPPDILAVSGDYRLLRLHRSPKSLTPETSFHPQSIADL